MPIFSSCVSHGHWRYTRIVSKTAGNPLGIAPPLFNQEMIMVGDESHATLTVGYTDENQEFAYRVEHAKPKLRVDGHAIGWDDLHQYRERLSGWGAPGGMITKAGGNSMLRKPSLPGSLFTEREPRMHGVWDVDVVAHLPPGVPPVPVQPV